jgi:hypothetical protein
MLLKNIDKCNIQYLNHGTCERQRNDSITDGMPGQTLPGPPAGQVGLLLILGLLLLLELVALYWLQCY